MLEGTHGENEGPPGDSFFWEVNTPFTHWSNECWASPLPSQGTRLSASDLWAPDEVTNSFCSVPSAQLKLFPPPGRPPFPATHSHPPSYSMEKRQHPCRHPTALPVLPMLGPDEGWIAFWSQDLSSNPTQTLLSWVTLGESRHLAPKRRLRCQAHDSGGGKMISFGRCSPAGPHLPACLPPTAGSHLPDQLLLGLCVRLDHRWGRQLLLSLDSIEGGLTGQQVWERDRREGCDQAAQSLREPSQNLKRDNHRLMQNTLHSTEFLPSTSLCKILIYSVIQQLFLEHLHVLGTGDPALNKTDNTPHPH